MGKKILSFTVIVFLFYFLITSPASAATTLRQGFETVMMLFSSLAAALVTFTQNLLN